MNNTALIVMSTDSYSDVWGVIFHTIKKNWNNIQFDTILITETKQPEIEGVTVINSPGHHWSEVLFNALELLPYEYVILMLDDMLVIMEVDNDVIISAVNFISSDENIACITLGGNDQTRITEHCSHQNYSIVADDSPFRVTTSPSLWRRKSLMHLIDKNESPWQFEINGTKRSRGGSYRFYNTDKKAINTFSTWLADTAIIRGKWQYSALKYIRSIGYDLVRSRSISFKSFPFMKYLVIFKRKLYSKY